MLLQIRPVRAVPSMILTAISAPCPIGSILAPHVGSFTIQIFILAFVLLNGFATLFRAEVMRVQAEPLTYWERKASAGWCSAGNTFGGLCLAHPDPGLRHPLDMSLAAQEGLL